MHRELYDETLDKLLSQVEAAARRVHETTGQPTQVVLGARQMWRLLAEWPMPAVRRITTSYGPLSVVPRYDIEDTVRCV